MPINDDDSISQEDRQLQETKRTEYQRDYKDAEKHYVRMNGWVPTAKKRLETIKRTTDRDSLKYFTLCAEQAIDIRLFGIENLVKITKRGYPAVGFCEREATVYETISSLLGQTKGFRAEFEDLVLNAGLPANKDFYSELPFDIYNLDFTGYCFPKSEPPFSRTLEAIVTLIQFLSNPRYRDGFDLFLTFRAKRSDENQAAINDLNQNMNDNIRDYDWFKDSLENRYGHDIQNLHINRYNEFLLITLPKYLGRVGRDYGFSVCCPFRFFYPRPDPGNPKYHIITFGLSFERENQERSARRDRRLRQPSILLEENTICAYLAMLRTLPNDMINICSIAFPRDQYVQAVMTLLEATEGEL